MGKVLLTFDARADQAEKEIKKLQKQIGQMSKEPQRAQRGMQGFGKSVGEVAGKFGLVASAAGAVSTIVAAIGDRLERNAKAAKVLGDNLRSIMAGSGLGQHTDEMRNFIQKQQAGGEFGMTQESTMQVLGAYTTTRPRATVDELKKRTLQANIVNRAFGGDIGSVGKWATYAGQLQQAGLGVERSSDIAYKLHTGLAQYAPDVVKSFQRISGASGVDAALEALPMLMSLGIANRRGTSSDQLRAQFQKNNNKLRYGTFENFVSNVPLEQIPEGVARDTLTTIRKGVPEEVRLLAGGGATEAAQQTMDSPLGKLRVETRQNISQREGVYDDPIAGAAAELRVAEAGNTPFGTLGTAWATFANFMGPDPLDPRNNRFIPTEEEFLKKQREVIVTEDRTTSPMQTITDKGAVQ